MQGSESRTGPLRGQRVAVLVSHGVDEHHLLYTLHELERSGATFEVLGPDLGGSVRTQRPSVLSLGKPLVGSDPPRFDAVVIPGGEQAARRLADHPVVIGFLETMSAQGKPIAAVGSGATVVDQARLQDGPLLTDRSGSELQPFWKALVSMVAPPEPEAEAWPR